MVVHDLMERPVYTKQKDTEISDNLNRAEALFEALYRKPVGNASDMALDASVVRH